MISQLFENRAVLSGLLIKLIQGVTGPITAMLVLGYFSPELQGYYYTFGSLLALQIFVELGLSGVITTFAAHEWAGLRIDQDGGISGDNDSLNSLAALARKAIHWYFSAAVVLLLFLLLFGYWFFASEIKTSEIHWLNSWLALCLLAAANFALTPAWALLTGCGQIEKINNYRLFETLLRSAVIWISIVMGASLWSPVISLLAVLIAGVIFLAIAYRQFFQSLFRIDVRAGWSWRNQIAPLQIKIGLSWLSGYFAYSTFTPLAFHFLGPSAAGQVGMTWAFTSGISGLAATWIQVQSPRLAILVSRRDYQMLDTLAMKAGWTGFAVCVVGALAGICLLVLLNANRPDIAARLLPVGAVSIFMFAEVLHQISMVESTYLRAFKQEPFLWLSLVTGVTIFLGNLIMIRSMGGIGSALAYLFGIVVALGWGTVIFFRCRQEWTFPRIQAE